MRKRPVPMPTKPVHPLNTVRRGFFDWQILLIMAIVAVVPGVIAAMVIAL